MHLSKTDTNVLHVWCRAGIILNLTPEEQDQVLASKDPSATIRKVLQEGRFTFNGESYIPQGVVEAAYAQRDGAVPDGCCDIDFYL